MMFFKRLSDAFDEARQGVIDHYVQEGQSLESATSQTMKMNMTRPSMCPMNSHKKALMH